MIKWLKPFLVIAVVGIVVNEFIWAGGLNLRAKVFKS